MKTLDPESKILGIPYPVIGLAPIDGISDAAFRQITKKYGNPDIMFTEFTHVIGLCVAAENLLKAFEYEEMERPIVAQIFGSDPEYFYHAAKIVCALGFDGVDINMGCPAHNVSSKGSGAGLIKTPDLAREIIFEVKRGVSDWVLDGKLTGLRPKAQRAVEQMAERNQLRITTPTPSFSPPVLGEKPKAEGVGVTNLLSRSSKLVARTSIPVSVKTRIGYDIPVTENWIKNLTKAEPEWISLHGRTLKQMYTGTADWSQIKIGVESTDIPIIANGDVKEYSDIKRVLDLTGAKGVLVARAAFGNPAIFVEPQKWKSELLNSNRQINYKFQSKNSDSYLEAEYILDILLEHAKLFDQYNPHSDRAFVQMRKHFAWYINTITKLQGTMTNESTSFNNKNPKQNDVEFFVKMKDLKMKLMQVNSLKEVEALVTSL